MWATNSPTCLVCWLSFMECFFLKGLYFLLWAHLQKDFFFKGARMPVEIPGTWLQQCGYRETWYLLLQISLSCYLFLCSLLDRRFWDCLGKYKFELHLHKSQVWVSDFSKAERCFGSLLQVGKLFLVSFSLQVQPFKCFSSMEVSQI